VTPHLRTKHVAVIAHHYADFVTYVFKNERLEEKGYEYHKEKRYYETPGEKILYYSPHFPERLKGSRFDRIVMVNLKSKDLEHELQKRLVDPVFGRITNVEV
jgi:hypothetical protein